MITTFSMEWIPREGVMWAAKYSSSGMRTFSTFGSGKENPIAHRNPPWSVVSYNRRLSQPLTSSFVSSMQEEGEGGCPPPQDRARSAPTQLLRHSGSRFSARGGRRKRECFSERTPKSPAGDQESKSWRRPSSNGMASSARRAHSAGKAAAAEPAAGGGGTQGPPPPRCPSSRFSRAHSAWSKLAKHVVSKSKPDPDPDLPPPKPLWGVMIARLPNTHSPPPPTTTSALSCTPRSMSVMSNSQSEFSQAVGPSHPRPPPAAAVISRTSFSRSRPPSASQDTDPTSRPGSPLWRSLRTLPYPPLQAESSSHMAEDPPQADSEKLQSALQLVLESGQASASEDAMPQSAESPPLLEDVEDLELHSARKGETREDEEEEKEEDKDEEKEEEEEVEERKTSARSNGHSMSVNSCPDSADEFQQENQCDGLDERRLSIAGTQKSDCLPSSKGDNTTLTSPFPAFENEVWYKKGSKYLAAQKAARNKGSSGNETEDLDPEFILQRLIRPTASSRSRQVTHWPAASYAHSSGAPPHKQKPPSIVIRPNRFKGNRHVSAYELRDIVNRLSACDPASVPDSGRSRSRGKGFGDRYITARSEPASNRLKSRPGLYVRGFAEELVRRSVKDA